MITAVEYRAWAEESLKWAREAATESEREAYTKSAEIWLQSACGVRARTPQPNTSGNCLPFKGGGARALQLKWPR